MVDSADAPLHLTEGTLLFFSFAVPLAVAGAGTVVDDGAGRGADAGGGSVVRTFPLGCADRALRCVGSVDRDL